MYVKLNDTVNFSEVWGSECMRKRIVHAVKVELENECVNEWENECVKWSFKECIFFLQQREQLKGLKMETKKKKKTIVALPTKEYS